MNRILVVDDDPFVCDMLKKQLLRCGYDVELAENGLEGLQRFQAFSPNVILLDLRMPVMTGIEFLKEIKPGVDSAYSIIILTGNGTDIEAEECYELGAQSFLRKPVNLHELKGLLKNSFRLLQYSKEIRNWNDTLASQVKTQVQEITTWQQTSIFAMAKLAESRDPETGEHIMRLSEFCKVIAQRLRRFPRYQAFINDQFIDTLYNAAPLHDIGKVGIPDYILLKPGKLTPNEFEIMKQHCRIGADTLREVNKLHTGNRFIQFGIEIAQSHHENWNGSGYPDGLKQKEIPLSAQILSMVDVYDALTSKRVYKKAYSHEESLRMIKDMNGIKFNENLITALLQSERQILAIKKQYQDSEIKLKPPLERRN